MTIHACILGATGYGGGELLRLLLQHPRVARIDGVSRSSVGQPFSATHPNLRGFTDGVFADAPDWRALAAADAPVLFAALPHGEFAKQWPGLHADAQRAGIADRLCVVDLSGDFRLRDPAAYARAYGVEHPCPEWLAAFRYALPELDGDPGRRIANPGCFATAIQLALAPLRDFPDPGFIAVTGVTGSSGSGATPSATTHHPTRAHDFRAYKVEGHQHMAEVEQRFAPSAARTVGFVAHSAPLVRGIFVTAQFKLPPAVDAQALRAAYATLYRAAPFVRMVDESPRVAAVIGTNFCDLSCVVVDGRAVVTVALDNLVKGMAGQAIQNMNRALAMNETAGLNQAALSPG
jgi:LysW-gamma-L-alpha-aminoadipyl-6-phosphate/LysW-L-glutamyl-5-phosphate reductase